MNYYWEYVRYECGFQRTREFVRCILLFFEVNAEKKTSVHRSNSRRRPNLRFANNSLKKVRTKMVSPGMRSASEVAPCLVHFLRKIGSKTEVEAQKIWLCCTIVLYHNSHMFFCTILQFIEVCGVQYFFVLLITKSNVLIRLCTVVTILFELYKKMILYNFVF